MDLKWTMIGTILLILVVWLYFSRVRIEITFKREAENDQGEVKVIGLGGLLRFRMNIPNVDFKGIDKGLKVEENTKTSLTSEQTKDTLFSKQKLEKFFHNYEEILHRVSHLRENIAWFMKCITCESWIWRTTVGTGDAAEAGILTGIVWAVKANVLGFISNQISWSKFPVLEVVPQFQHAVFHTYYKGRFSFRLGNAIRLAIRLWFRFQKDKKRNWRENDLLST